MSLFRLDASVRSAGSVTREVADTVEKVWTGHHPDGAITRRDVGRNPLGGDLWPAAILARFEPDTAGEVAAEAGRVAAELADELAGAESYLFAVPLYNFGVSQQFKTWYDLVCTEERFAPGTTTIAGRPAVLVTARGGGYAPGTPREGWDHATPWMRRVLTDVWGLDLRVVETELTLADVTPQMAELRGLAAELKAAAHLDAEKHGAHLRTGITV